MPRVSETVLHILLHVDAEATTSDPSQTPGVGRRAQKIRDLLSPFAADTRDRSRQQLLEELRTTTDLETRGVLNGLPDNDDGDSLVFALQEWVGKG